jgi:hypothetical protein
MTRAEIVGVLDRRADAWRRLDAETLVADYAEDAVDREPAGWRHDAGSAIRFGRSSRPTSSPFPIWRWTSKKVLVRRSARRVMATFTGTDRGGFMGNAGDRAAGSRSPSVFLYEFKDGKIVRDRRVYDFTGMLVQVGTLKAKPA